MKYETIEARIGSDVFRRRVSKGQRFISVCQREEWGRPIVTTHMTADHAERYSEVARQRGCEFHAWAEADVV